MKETAGASSASAWGAVVARGDAELGFQRAEANSSTSRAFIGALYLTGYWQALVSRRNEFKGSTGRAAARLARFLASPAVADRAEPFGLEPYRRPTLNRTSLATFGDRAEPGGAVSVSIRQTLSSWLGMGLSNSVVVDVGTWPYGTAFPRHRPTRNCTHAREQTSPSAGTRYLGTTLRCTDTKGRITYANATSSSPSAADHDALMGRRTTWCATPTCTEQRLPTCGRPLKVEVWSASVKNRRA